MRALSKDRGPWEGEGLGRGHGPKKAENYCCKQSLGRMKKKIIEIVEFYDRHITIVDGAHASGSSGSR